MTRRRLYNPAQLTPDELKASFVAREETLAEMLRLIGEQPPGRPCQHLMLIGPRGMGKTTLGLRFLHAVGEAPDLAAGWQPVAFHEESYEIGDLADFWLAALRHLTRATEAPRWADRADALVRDERDTERLAAYAFAALMDFCRESGKRLILFVENLDAVFAQLRNEREVHALRASLIECPDILLLGSANTVFEAIRGYGEPFYEFFRLFILEGLEREEVRRMLEAVADSEGSPDIQEVLCLARGRLETIRRLTGGNPRLLVLACRMLIESPLGDPLEDLERLIDEQTPYFKAQVEKLPVQARKVFHCLAEGWKPLLAKEVAGAAKLSSSHASAQLKQLVDKGYAREKRLPRTNRTRYEVSDRFYNIYHLLRFSRASRDRLERLVAFLHDLFGPAGMRTMYPRALAELRAHVSRAGEVSDWLGILAGYVAEDEGFKGREDWRREALDLADTVIGSDAPVIEEIHNTFAGRDRSGADRHTDLTKRIGTLFKAGRFADAEAACQMVIKERPDDSLAWMRLGVALAERRHFKDAIAAFDRALESISPNDNSHLRTRAIAVLLRKGTTLVRMNRFKTAVAAYEQVSEFINSSDPAKLRHLVAVAYRLNGMLLVELDRNEEALAAWQRTSEHIRPDAPAELRQMAAEALRDMGGALVELDRPEEAIAAWERITEYVREEAPTELRHLAFRALLAKGMVVLQSEQYEDSMTVWLRISEYIRPDDPMKPCRTAARGVADGGYFLSCLGRYDEAEAACRKAMDIDPKHDAPWRVLAEVILQQADDTRLPEAEDCARRAVELAPESPNAFHTLSNVLARRGKWREALNRLERAFLIGGGDFQIRKSLIPAVAAGQGLRIKRLMEEAGLVEPMEPLWHAIKAELGEELEPLPAEIMDTVNDLRQDFAEERDRI